MKNYIATFSLLLLGASPLAHAEGRNVHEYNLQNGLALKGFDPVAVFPEGGGKPVRGVAAFREDYLGATYLFANAADQAEFLKDPSKYEPTYGGWCAYAMSEGTKVDIQPTLFTLKGRRAFYFVSGRAKQNFDHDVDGREALADGFWMQMSGEEPRR
jgi:YHS domain-containing protein